MEITVTFRHVDPTPALRDYAREKVTRVTAKYLRRPGDAHVILEVSKGRHIAEITLQAEHNQLFAKEETHDLYEAIDLAIAKLEHQAQKLKAKHRGHKGGSSARTAPGVAAGLLSAERRSRDGRPKVIRTKRLPGKPMSVDEAVAILASSRDEFFVFTNAVSQTLAVLYRRKDGNYGLIEPEGN